jgi:hypothetical protein
MITLLIIAIYFAIGYCLAIWNIPGSWNRARITWSDTTNQRGDVRVSFITMLLLWPLRLPVRLIASRVDAVITARDPQELERRLRDRDTRIAELERELGYR